MRHVILRGFEREEDRGLVGVSKSRRFHGEGPEEIAYPSCQAADGRGSRLAARAPFRAIQKFEIRFLQCPLRGEHKDRFAGHALREQVTHPFDARGCFACPRGTRDEEFGVEGRLDDLPLDQAWAGKDVGHTSEGSGGRMFCQQGRGRMDFC